jgi:hypothetical protein
VEVPATTAIEKADGLDHGRIIGLIADLQSPS